MTKLSDGADKQQHPQQHAEPLTGLYDNDHMKGLVLNKMNYNSGASDQGGPSTGPKLNELTIDEHKVHEMDAPQFQGQRVPKREVPVSNENYQKIAKEGTDFIGINGNINLQVKHALDEARQTDKADGTGHHNVDKLLSYMNDHLKGTYFSVARHNETFMLLDSRDNKPNSHNEFKVHAREKWNMATKKYENGP